MNMIADDPRKPMDPSGIRFGTPAITTRGFKEKECKRVAELMIEVLKNKDDKKIKEKVHKEIIFKPLRLHLAAFALNR